MNLSTVRNQFTPLMNQAIHEFEHLGGFQGEGMYRSSLPQEPTENFVRQTSDTFTSTLALDGSSQDLDERPDSVLIVKEENETIRVRKENGENSSTISGFRYRPSLGADGQFYQKSTSGTTITVTLEEFDGNNGMVGQIAQGINDGPITNYIDTNIPHDFSSVGGVPVKRG